MFVREVFGPGVRADVMCGDGGFFNVTIDCQLTSCGMVPAPANASVVPADRELL
jgi:hypothetical protein